MSKGGLLFTHHSSLITHHSVAFMDLQSVQNLLSTFGLTAIFLLTMAEGDITLLLAGGPADGPALGPYRFPRVLAGGAVAGGARGDPAHFPRRGARFGAKKDCFHLCGRPRLVRLT